LLVLNAGRERASRDPQSGVVNTFSREAPLVGRRGVLGRNANGSPLIRSAAADPEVAEVLAKSRHDRAVGHLMLAAALRKKRGYATKVPMERAADLMYGLGTEDSYLIFVVDRGWPPDDWERWVVETVCTQLTP
jgi:hypothetical protein